MPRPQILVTSLLLLILLIAAGWIAPLVRQGDISEEDIHYVYIDGDELLHGQNPYSRVRGSDMLHNQDYATYFPVFYELSLLSEKAGLTQFDNWVNFWQIVFILFDLATGVLLYAALARRGLPWIGAFATAFWLFNRWTLQVLQIVDLDFLPIFFLVLSLVLFPRKRWLSLFFFSLSLGLKQIAIFLVPLYLIWTWQSAPEGRRLRELLIGVAVIASVPLITSLPFLFWDLRGFIYSVLFSATRLANKTKGLGSPLSYYLGASPLLDRILMLGLLAVLYAFAWLKWGTRYLLAFMTMLVFLYFNPVLFVQYNLWPIPLGLLLFADVRDAVAAQRPVASQEVDT